MTQRKRSVVTKNFSEAIDCFGYEKCEWLYNEVNSCKTPLDRISTIYIFLAKEELYREMADVVLKKFDIGLMDYHLFSSLVGIKGTSLKDEARNEFLKAIDYIREHNIKSYIYHAYLLGIMRDETDEKEFNDLMKKGGVVERDAILIERYFLDFWDEKQAVQLKLWINTPVDLK